MEGPDSDAPGSLRLTAWRTFAPLILGGTLSFLAYAALNHWSDSMNLPASPALASSAVSAPPETTRAPALPELEISVHFITVPENNALEIMNSRWSDAGDTALLFRLTGEAAQADKGVSIVRVLKGTWRTSGSATLRESRPVACCRKTRAGSSAQAAPGELTDIRNVGSSCVVDATLADDGSGCDLRLLTSHDFAEPLIHSISGGETAGEFREVRSRTSVWLRSGSASLIQCSQLPLLPGLPADREPRRLFTFVQVRSLPAS